MEKPKVLLFDLGGVIVRWVGLDAVGEITGLSREAVSDRFAASKVFRDYETGRCDDDSFAKALITEFKLEMSLPAAKRLWNSWVQDCYAGTKEMLSTLRKDYSIACLSNTKALHWGHLQTHINIDKYLDYSFASHLIKAAKPKPESYQICIEKMGVNPSDIWFFDDTLMNIDAAASLGMKAFHVDRNVGVIPTLRDLALWP